MLCLWLRRERDIWGGDQIYPEVPSGTPHPPNNVRGMHCIWHTFCGGALHSRLTYNFLPFVPIVDPQKKTQRMSPNALLFQMCTSFTYLGSQTVLKVTVFVSVLFKILKYFFIPADNPGRAPDVRWQHGQGGVAGGGGDRRRRGKVHVSHPGFPKKN